MQHLVENSGNMWVSAEHLSPAAIFVAGPAPSVYCGIQIGGGFERRELATHCSPPMCSAKVLYQMRKDPLLKHDNADCFGKIK